jgi:hypothetical protein
MATTVDKVCPTLSLVVVGASVNPSQIKDIEAEVRLTIQ